MKKVISITLALIMALSLPVTVFALEITAQTPSADENGVYQISNAEELYGFAELVNGGETSANAVLTDNIVVNSNVLNESGALNSGDFASWTPIGSKDVPYAGTFDGQGYTISGLYYDAAVNYVGLFGYIGGGGEISNVGVVDSYICGQNCVGSVCGYSYDGTITDCYNTGTVCGSDQHVGGVCGLNNYGTISGCYNTGKVSPVSGSTFTYSYGGVCGENGEGTISDCYNTGTVTNTSGAGGVCGDNGGTITNCYNEGKVQGGDSYSGGICSSSSGTISNCYNKGAIGISYGAVGGICGWCGSSSVVIGCYNEGEVNGYKRTGGICGMNKGAVTACYNTASVTGTNENIGGICGDNYNELNEKTGQGTITGCYNLGEVSGGTYVGAVCGSTHQNTKIKGCYAKAYSDSDLVCASSYYNTVTDCAMYTDEEFTDGTVLDLLNAALESAGANVFFYSNTEIGETPALTDPTVTAYTVTIPETVKLGEKVTISATDVTLKRVEKLTVAITETSEADNTFKLRSADNIELAYTVKNGESDVAIGDDILNLGYTDNLGTATLNFCEPTEKKFSGSYSGTVTFTVSVNNIS